MAAFNLASKMAAKLSFQVFLEFTVLDLAASPRTRNDDPIIDINENKPSDITHKHVKCNWG